MPVFRSPSGPAGATVGGHALPYAALAGALAVSSGDPVGPLGPLRWVGAPELLAGSMGLLLASVLGLFGVATRLRVFVAGAVVGAGAGSPPSAAWCSSRPVRPLSCCVR